MKDILILCSDGLTSIREAITSAFPKTEQQRCIVHMVRNALKYVSDKDRKVLATDLKTIYHAAKRGKGIGGAGESDGKVDAEVPQLNETLV